ncbi:hypothetical protein A8924_6357 [Saccharopolyspora erythraea NRRL 2338]|uniref:Uncharacterized protein n=1 Tax=Saccharopolyspora erythraea TaxID=1836 RepID=A0ABN1BX92_SACER|nr:hypothetical protein [Saccharopolyspora erythraea]EQD87828.1 hypothetical protein N599_02530 [Saccharopolyspora erythraea D]PFG98831.1 hypothetical protein A8924_6357 [Saccharopolyspora erythraea NRRL 2338]QRK88826.1 hypothetical protein JQX30_30120 [Saccharopolyspora erythraea]
MTDVLSVPDEQEFLNEFGEAPQVQDEPWIRSISISSDNGTLELSFDSHERSIRFEWRDDDDVLWEFFRETATSLVIRNEGGETYFVVSFESAELSGNLDVRVYPKIAIKDVSLRD